jgi:hypothetical protein
MEYKQHEDREPEPWNGRSGLAFRATEHADIPPSPERIAFSLHPSKF